MRISCVCQMGAALLSAVFVSGTASPTCGLFDEFPDKYNGKNAAISRLVVVTLRDGDAFCRLFTLTSKHPLKGQPPMSWCGYAGFDREYHYAHALQNPGEIYRVRRELVNNETLVRELGGWEQQNRDDGGTSITLPVSDLASEWLHRAKLDRSLAPLETAELPAMFIVFRNAGDTGLEQLAVSGFSVNPVCGELVPRAQKASVNVDPFPNKILITWRFKGEADQTTAVNIPEAARHASKGELRFEFAKSRTWSATFKESAFKD